MKVIFMLPVFMLIFNCSNHAQCNASFTYVTNNGLVVFKAADSSETLTHYWDLGNGYFTNNGQMYNPSQTFNPGSYMIRHLVIDSVSHCRDSVTQTLNLDFKLSCNASFVPVHSFLSEGQYLFYSNTTFSGNVSIVNYAWVVDGVQQSNNYGYLNDSLADGSHQVCLSIVTDLGCSSSVCDTVTVSTPVKCNSNTSFEAIQSPVNNDTVEFSATPALAGFGYQWNFGDGSFTDSINVEHTYSTPGTYTATLTVFDSVARYCADTMSRSIIISAPPADSCSDAFSYTWEQSGVFLTAQSAGPVLSAVWQIYRQNSSTVCFSSNDINPLFSLTDTGYYVITALVTTTGGCKNYYTYTIHIDGHSGNRQNNLVQSYPNPAASHVTLYFIMEVAGPVTYDVYSNSGIPVYQKKIQGQKGSNTITIPLQQLGKGQYFVNIKYGKERKQSVFQKL